MINISHLDLNNISQISKVNINNSNSKKTHIPNVQSGGLSNVPNDISKLSIISNNHHHQNSNPITDLKKSNRDNYSEYISTLDSILEADEETNNRKISQENYSEIKSKLSLNSEKFIAKYNILKEKKEKLNKFIDELRVAKDSNIFLIRIKTKREFDQKGKRPI